MHIKMAGITIPFIYGFTQLNGEILLQQRSHKKIIHPLLWDVSTAGHIDAGESFLEAALRETKEENWISSKTSKSSKKLGLFFMKLIMVKFRIMSSIKFILQN